MCVQAGAGKDRSCKVHILSQTSLHNWWLVWQNEAKNRAISIMKVCLLLRPINPQDGQHRQRKDQQALFRLPADDADGVF
jgi:hypothetical protein